MATDIEKLLVQLSADIKKYENALGKALGVTNKQAKAIETRFAKMNRGMTADFAQLGKGLGAAFAAAGSLAGFKDLLDASTRVQNALRVAGLSGEELTRVYDALFSSAQRNSVPIETMAQLYGRLAVIQKELKVGSAELLSFTDKIGLALRVAGTDAQSASGALLQLSQALGAGVVRAEEFNSVQEGALPILQAAARGIKEAGGSVATLRKLVLEGKVSSQALFQGFLAGTQQLEKQAATSVSTVEQAFTRLRNSLIDAVGKLDLATGAGAKAAGIIDSLASYVTALSDAFGKLADGPIGTAIEKLNSLAGIVNVLLPQIEALKNLPSNIDTVASAVNREINTYLGNETKSRDQLSKDLQNLQTAVRNGTAPNAAMYLEEIKRISALLYGDFDRPRVFSGARQVAPVKPSERSTEGSVSIVDPRYAVTPTSPKKKGSSTKVDDYQRAIEAANKQTAAINAETAAREKLNPLVNDYGYAVAKATKEQELLTAAKEAGKAVDADMAAEIKRTATAYAEATAAAAKLEETQEKIRQSVEFQKDVLNGALSDMRTALEDGKLTWKDLGNVAVNVLNKIADKLQEMLVDQLFAKGFGGLFGSFLGLGGAVAGGVSGAGAVGAAKAASAMAPRLPSAGQIAKAQAVDVVVSVDDEGSLRTYVQKEGRRTEARVAAGTQMTFDNYRRNQLHNDINSHVRSPRRRGSI